MSTSLKVVSWAAVFCDSFEPQRDGLAQSAHRHAFFAISIAGADRSGTGAAGLAARSAARVSSAASMSPLVTRPSLPVPLTLAG